MEEPIISIIIPIYKVPEQYLRKCIDSVVNQTLKNIEILLIDDGSPDKCGAICDEYAREFDSVRTIHKPNGGLSSSRNAGVLAANGHYIMFVDGDDWIEPNTCEILYQNAASYNVDLIMFGMSKDYSDKSVKYDYCLKERHKYEGAEIKWLQTQVLNYNSNIVTATTKLIKRSVIINNQIFHNERLKQGAEGIVFNIDLFDKIESAFFVKEYFYHYRYNDSSISASYNEDNIKLVIDCFDEIKSKIVKMSNCDELMEIYKNRLIYAIVTTVISGYMNPSNPDSYKTKKSKCEMYLQNEIVKEALETANMNGISKSRKAVVGLIQNRMYLLIYLLGFLRKWQKTHL